MSLRGGVLVLLALLAPCWSAHGQQPGLSGYYLNVGTRVGAALASDAGASDFQRLRLMWVKDLGNALIDVGYEHTLVIRQTGAQGAQLFTTGGTASGGDWVDLTGQPWSGARGAWRHRVDRLNVQLDLGESGDIVVGRQPISWATTLILTPGDPFSPFDPADPFREYRIGVDAARIRYYRGSFTQLEMVVRPAKVGSRETLTVLGKASTNRNGWDVGAWAGSLHDSFASAAFLSGAVGDWALRFEGGIRDTGDRTVWRSSVGIDGIVPFAGHDLYLVFEYQRDGLGAAAVEDLLPLGNTTSFAQGEVQVLGRDTGAAQFSLQVHPLVSTDLLVLANLRDGSMILGPGIGYSVTHSSALRFGAFLGLGDDASVDQAGPVLNSEYGASPALLFASFNLFF